MADPIPITYLTDAQNYIPLAMQPNFGRHGYGLSAYQPGQPFSRIFLIISPIWNGHHFQSVEGVWARYLAKTYPHTKLIIVGSSPSYDPNYVDLFDLPDDWSIFFEKAAPASRFLSKTPVFTGGMDMMERLHRFLMGHGNESMAEVCKNLLFCLSPGIDAISIDRDGTIIRELIKELDSKYVKSLWPTLQTRWANYHPLFVFLPFQSTFEEIQTIIEQLAYVFEGKETDEESIKSWFAEVTPRLERLCSLLNELMTYVRK